MKRNHKNTKQNQTEALSPEQSAVGSDSPVEETTVPMAEVLDETQENQEPQQTSGPSETKKALLGELRAVLDHTKQETGAAAKTLDQETKDIRQAVAAASRIEEQESLPAQKEEAPLVSLTYESMAEAAEMARKESTGRFSRDAVDDETFLAELYTLIGDGEKPKTEKQTNSAAATRKPSAPITPRPAGRITPEKLQAASEEFEDVLEDDEVGVPGWLKGAFLLLIALLLSAMTFYAVATDVIGKIF